MSGDNQKSEDGGQRSEVRDQKSEVRDQVDPKDYLVPVTVQYLKGKRDGKLYPIDANESMLEYAVAAQGGPRKCNQCNEYFCSSPGVYLICLSCRMANQLKKFIDARAEKPGEVIMSLVTGDYGHGLEDFEEAALDFSEPGQDLCNDAIVWHCQLVNPTPNYSRCVDWDDLTADVQPAEGEYVDPIEKVSAAIRALNEAIGEQGPVSYGPDWETRLPISEEFLKREVR